MRVRLSLIHIFLRNSHQLARQLDDAFLVDVFEYRNNQTVRGIHRHTDVDVFLQEMCIRDRGLGAIPSAARSATCLRYSSSTTVLLALIVIVRQAILFTLL